jgi:hypothetical protein
MGKETFSTGNILKWKNRTKKKKLYTLAKRTNYNKPLNPVELTAHVKNN